jgi:hypothetical protein
MAYTIKDLKELIEYHLIAAATNDDVANNNLAQLVTEIQHLSTRPLWQEATWVFCDRCGCSVDTVLIHPDGHQYSDDGDFYYVDCWEHLDMWSLSGPN